MKNTAQVIGLLFLIFWILKALESFFPFGHGDPLYYHLVFSKMLFERGWYETHKNLCGVFQSGAMEYLYILPRLITNSNLSAQRLSQFMHFFLSIGVTSLFVWGLFKKQYPLIAALGGFIFLTFNKGSTFFLYAKNDGVTPFLLILFYVIFISSQNINSQNTWIKKFNHPLVAGLILALMPLFKINGLISGGLFGLYYIWTQRRSVKNIILCAIPPLCLVPWLFIRNWYFIKAPFFPGLLKVFPGILPASVVNTFVYFASSPPTFLSVIDNLKTFFFAKIIFITIPFLVVVYLKTKKPLPKSIIFSFLIFTIAMITNGGISAERFLFPCYFLNAFFILEFIFDFQLDKKKWFVWPFFIIIVLDSRIDIVIKRIKNEFLFQQLKTEKVVTTMSPKAGVWEKLPNTALTILSDEWNEIYYAPKGTILHSSECTLQAGFLQECTQSDLSKLSSYDLFIIKRWANNPCYDSIKESTPLLFKYEGYEFHGKIIQK